MWPPKYAMFTGAGSPATGGPTGEQQIGGGWRAGFCMLFASGMYSGWCVTSAGAEAAKASAARAAAAQRRNRFITGLLSPLLRDGEGLGRGRRGVEALRRGGVDRVLADRRRRDRDAPARPGRGDPRRDRTRERRVVDRDLHRLVHAGPVARQL